MVGVERAPPPPPPPAPTSLFLFFLRALRALFIPWRGGSNGCKGDHPSFWGKGLVFKRGAFKMKAPGFRV